MEPYEIVTGPLELWFAPVGTAFPAIGAAPAGTWKKVGTSGSRNYSEDGVQVTHSQTVNKIRPDGAIGAVKAVRADEDMMFAVTIWDMTVEQYTLGLSGLAPVTTAAGVGTPGYKKLGLSRGKKVALYALLVRGVSAYDATMAAQWEVPRCFQSANPAPQFRKGQPAGLLLTFDALEDLAATSDDERFGRLLVQHQTALP